MKLNLCCGQMILDGYVNIDATPMPGVDVVSDARELQFGPCTVSAVVWFHAIEHFTLDDACMLIRGIYSWLEPGGYLLVEGPDVVKAVVNSKERGFSTIQDIFGDLTELRNGLSGYQHLWGWTGELVKQELLSAGFLVGNVENGISHGKEWRDYRVVGFKPK